MRHQWLIVWLAYCVHRHKKALLSISYKFPISKPTTSQNREFWSLRKWLHQPTNHGCFSGDLSAVWILQQVLHRLGRRLCEAEQLLWRPTSVESRGWLLCYSWIWGIFCCLHLLFGTTHFLLYTLLSVSLQSALYYCTNWCIVCFLGVIRQNLVKLCSLTLFNGTLFIGWNEWAWARPTTSIIFSGSYVFRPMKKWIVFI